MPETPFPFVTDGDFGDVPINFYPSKDSDKRIILRSTPGLDEFCDLTDCTEVRGLYAWDSYLYAVAQRGSHSVLWRIDSAGAFAEVGTLTTSASGNLWMTNNLTQLCICDGAWSYVYTPSSGIFLKISDVDFPGSGAMDYQDGYGLFITPDSSEWFFSNQYDFRAYTSTDFYNKMAKPDDLVSILSFFREVWLFGTDKGTEVWYNSGGSGGLADPTFVRNAGGLIEIGCGAARSPSTMDGTAVGWLSDKGKMIQTTGYVPKEINNQMFAREVQGYSTFADAFAFTYVDQGHTFYQITFPTGDTTWVYDMSTGLWFKKTSYDGAGGWGRHRAQCYARFNNNHYVGDYNNGKVYEMSSGYYDDNGQTIRRQLYTPEQVSGIPYTRWPDVMLDLEMGVGVAQGLTPQIMAEISNDGGHTWSSEIWREAGAVGEYTKRAIWRRLGSSPRRGYRLTFTDSIPWKVLGVVV